MPIVTFHLVENQFDSAQIEQLLTQAAQRYAEILESPLERIRAFLQSYPAPHALVSGQVLKDDDQGAPYFEFIVLEGRPQSQINALMTAFTDLVERCLGVDRSVIRGRCIRVSPDDWCIAGQPASKLRAGEITARKS